MNGWLIFVLIYILGGIITTVILSVAAERNGTTSPVFFLDGNPAIVFAWLFLWPLFAAISAVELSFPKEKTNEIEEEKAEIEIGEIGTSETQMRPTGRVKINEIFIEAYSLSGPLEAGEKVEIISKDMSHYKIRKVEQDGCVEC